MKSIFIVSLLLWQTSELLNKADRDELFRKIKEQEIILKPELEKNVNRRLAGYEEKFFGMGEFIASGNLIQGTVQGIRNDTLFNISIVFGGEKCIAVKEHPYASIYRKQKTIHEKYRLGYTYSTYKSMDTTCIMVYFETFQPYNVETLKGMFYNGLTTVLKRDSLEFCAGKN